LPDEEVYEFKSGVKPTWCPGCGDYAVLNAVHKALTNLKLEPWRVAIISGIGCSSNLPHFLTAFGVHGIHGRVMPIATGLKLANPELTVIGTGGDGDGYGIGAGHFIHAMRRNLDITYIVMDNQIYGLTTGQASPTSLKEMKTKSTPEGVIENPINPIALALASGATYISRGFSGDPKGLAELIEAGIKHKGFSLVDVFSPCVTYNKYNTYDYFRPKVYSLQKENHDTEDIGAAWKKALEWGERIPIGIFYVAEGVPTYEDLEPAYKQGMPLKQKLGIADPKELIEEAM
jgi:2-oxoglutarate ferredoxin oxidoreductase subunit beta